MITTTNRLHDKQVNLLQTHFLNKQASSPLHAAVVRADDRLTPLDLHRAHEKELATEEEYINKVKSPTWPTPALLEPTTCRHRSVEQMAYKCRSVCRNRRLFNSNTGPSHTNEKLHEIRFGAARHWWAVQKMWKRTGDDPAHYCSMWAISTYLVCKKTRRRSKSYPPGTGRSSWTDWRQKSIL